MLRGKIYNGREVVWKDNHQSILHVVEKKAPVPTTTSEACILQWITNQSLSKGIHGRRPQREMPNLGIGDSSSTPFLSRNMLQSLLSTFLRQSHTDTPSLLLLVSKFILLGLKKLPRQFPGLKTLHAADRYAEMAS
jgi:hypothetical protein